MTASLVASMVGTGSPIYHTPEYLTYVHVHKETLMNNAMRVAVDPGLAYKFEYNFTSLLIELGYRLEDQTIMLVVNGFTCPTEMTRDFKEMVVPNSDVISIMKKMYRQSEGRI